MIRGLRQRTLEKLAYRFWTKDKTRSSEENWKLAVKELEKIERIKKIKPRDKRKKSK